MNKQPVNITNIIKKYGPGYVAKTKKSGRVVAHARTLDVLFDKTKDREDLTIAWVPKEGGRYVFGVSIRIRAN